MKINMRIIIILRIINNKDKDNKIIKIKIKIEKKNKNNNDLLRYNNNI